jgi:CubicO group peptidase (beta-lactamase class C family)
MSFKRETAKFHGSRHWALCQRGCDTLEIDPMLASLLVFLAAGLPSAPAIDATARALLAKTRANGVAIALIDRGEIRHVGAYGTRDAKGQPLTPDTVMYGASLTKTVFAYTVLQLVDLGLIDLDQPLANYLDKPLPEYEIDRAQKYGPYPHLAADERWKKITARMCLTHSTGFHNFWFLEADRKLKIHFEPGSRYSYSGEGFILLQSVIERGKLGLDAGALTQSIFDRLGMKNTSLIWRPDFARNLADGWNDQGQPLPHDDRGKVRAAGSMDTTIADMARFVAALVRGDGLTRASRREFTKPSLAIRTASQFPLLTADAPQDRQRPDLAAGLGVIVFHGPQGRGFLKGGHDEQTANTMVCLEQSRRCVVVLSNDVRAEAGFADLVQALLGDTGVPYDWEYGGQAGKS